MSAPIRVALATLAVASLTWAVGWWAVVPVAVVVGLLPARARLGGGAMALAAALAWGALLAWQASHGRFGALLERVEGVLRLPSAALVVVALLFPALLGWAGTTLGGVASALGGRASGATRPGAA